ncbi:MAG: gamma-butyrobetaine hydroxylase-like domain-containing protein [Pseudomonadota bacterium]
MPDLKAIWPEELRYDSAARRLNVTTVAGAQYSISAQRLREHSPSAEVRGHGAASPDQPRPSITGKEDVQIIRMAPIGRYAVRLIFDDGHDSGLYTWAYLRELSAL